MTERVMYCTCWNKTNGTGSLPTSHLNLRTRKSNTCKIMILSEHMELWNNTLIREYLIMTRNNVYTKEQFQEKLRK